MADQESSQNNIPVFPVMGYGTMSAYGTSVVLQLHFARSEAHMKAGGEKLLFALGPAQAREIALKILALADKLETPPNPSVPKN